MSAPTHPSGGATAAGQQPGEDEVVLSYWNALEHGNKFRKKETTIAESCPKPIEKTHLREEPCGTAVSKLHGRAPRGAWRLPLCGEHFYDFW
jgi:hypothetical protein